MEHKFCPYCMNPVEEGKPCGACGLTQGSYTPSPHHLPPGTVLKDRYLVGRVLGEGGFGITYIGCDLQLELKVAIKEYFPTDKASRLAQVSLEVSSYAGAAGAHYDKGLTKFLQEARTIARMDKQPVIVNVRDFFQVNHTAYIVMEYVEGTTFKELVDQRGGRIPARELLRLMEPLFFALKEMHDNGLIHRDISPDNLMLEKGEVRLLDFGCARESADGGNTLTIALKHGYAPVEQYQSKGQGPWTDVYALSATIYYCLTGKKPPQAMDRLVEDELVPPRKLGVELTQRQEKALLYGMGVAPKRRYQSMEEFHTALYEGFGSGAPEETGGGPEPAVTDDAAADDGPEPAVTVDAEADRSPEPAAAVDGSGADTPDTAEKTAAAPPAAEKGPFDFAAWLKKNKLLAGGVAAALALVILLAAVLPRVLGQPNADGPAETDAPSEGLESPPGTEPGTYSMTASTERSLLSQLEDDMVDSVIVPTGTWLDVDQPVTLTKTLRVEQNAGVNLRSTLTVAQGGRVEVEGSVDVIALLRTIDGGTVSVESGGWLSSPMLWLERENDLICASDGQVDCFGRFDPSKGPASDPWEQSHYLVLDEETLFADAVRVASEAEFVQHCQGEKPVVIDGEIALTHFREASVPILVSEGAIFSAPCDDTDCTLDLVQGGLMVNRGTVRGRISMLGNYEVVSSVSRFLNLGRAEVCLNSFGGPSSVVNLGELSFFSGFDDEPMLEGVNLANAGGITIGPGVSVSQHGNWSNNGGTIALSGGTYTLMDEGTGFSNFGVISLENSARLVNGGEIHDHGTITVSPDSAIEGPGKYISDREPDPAPEDTEPPASELPSAEPTPESHPSTAPTAQPASSPQPSAAPTAQPTPSPQPSVEPTAQPTPSPQPSAAPTPEPTSVRIGSKDVPLDATELDLGGMGIRDISPVAKLTKLEVLTLWNNPISDVSALSGLTNLKRIDLIGTQVSDLSPLRGLTKLNTLYLDSTRVSDISPLAGCTGMTELHLDDTQVSNVSALSGMTRMVEVTFNHCPVRDVSVVRNMPGLKRCGINGTQVTDLTLFHSFQLEWLLVSPNQFTQQQLDELRATQPSNFDLRFKD